MALLNEYCVLTSVPAEIPRGVLTLKTLASPGFRWPLGNAQDMEALFATCSSQTELLRTLLRALDAPCHKGSANTALIFLLLDLAFAVPSSWNAFPPSWTPDKYLLHVASTGISQLPPLPGSHRTYTLSSNYLFSHPPPNSVVGSPRESLHLQYLARTLHRGRGVRLVGDVSEKRVNLLSDGIRISKVLTCWICGLNPTRGHLTEVNVMFCTCISSQWPQRRRGAKGRTASSMKEKPDVVGTDRCATGCHKHQSHLRQS